MKIAILVEGDTEVFFIKNKLHQFLQSFLEQQMPTFTPIKKGRIPKKEKLRGDVEKLLTGKNSYDTVIALTDVYTGTRDFLDAADAKTKMTQWVGNNPKFYPHTALHDFEAWLLPYWGTIQKLAKHNRKAPSASPETVNHERPPSYWIKEIFRLGGHQDYNKPIHGKKILNDNDLMIAIEACPELKAFVNQIIALCDQNKVI